MDDRHHLASQRQHLAVTDGDRLATARQHPRGATKRGGFSKGSPAQQERQRTSRRSALTNAATSESTSAIETPNSA